MRLGSHGRRWRRQQQTVAPLVLLSSARLGFTRVAANAVGEGGEQVLRTALSLSVVLGRRVTLRGIRARRPRPGLQPQHLTVVRALAAISGAEVTGDTLDSTDVTFAPRGLRGGSYDFDVGAIRGSAGSVSLLFQALLLPLTLATEPSRLVLRGGTHVRWSPPVHYLTAVFLPALGRIGVHARLSAAAASAPRPWPMRRWIRSSPISTAGRPWTITSPTS